MKQVKLKMIANKEIIKNIHTIINKKEVLWDDDVNKLKRYWREIIFENIGEQE